MILPDFKGFPSWGRILGVDWGAVRTGVAVSDPTGQFVFTRPVVVSRPGDKNTAAQKINDLIISERVVGVVIGLPLYADNTDSETTAMVRKFAADLSKITDLPICFIPENLTSVSAQEQMGRVNQHRIKTELDSESARIILENAIAIIKRDSNAS